MLQLKDAERGRILALLIVSVFMLFIFLLNSRAKLTNLRRDFSNFIIKFSLATNKVVSETNIKPIMILIPAYNEAANLGLLLQKMPKSICGKEVGVLVIDDGSADNTAEIAKDNNCVVFSNIINRGQGIASKIGYEILKGKDVEVVVTMDADNQHLPSDVEKMVTPILETDSDLVIGF